MAYTPQMVKKSDYARVLAEFWADGPDSETPPGHWFTILNYVSDHPETVKKFGGQGSVLSDLEWDVKSYLVLGGAMHDSAVNIWGIKGYYDYVRPISAIRYMASNGQSTDNTLPSFDSHGLPLIPGLIEVIATGDELAGDNNINVGKIKVKSWKGPDFIDNRLDFRHTLVALSKTYFCNTTICRIPIWSFYFFESSSNIINKNYWKSIFSRRNGYI